MVDESCNDKGSGAGIILCSPEGDKVFYVLRFEFKATDNQSKYEAFIAGLRLVLALRTEKIKVRIDSQLVTNHFNESFQARGEKIELYQKKAKQLMRMFKEVKSSKYRD